LGVVEGVRLGIFCLTLCTYHLGKQTCDQLTDDVARGTRHEAPN
jgi:hypothetical protein